MFKKGKSRRVYDEDFKAEAVRMLLDGHSAGSVASRLGVSCPTTIRRWKQQHELLMHSKGLTAKRSCHRHRSREPKLAHAQRQ